MYKPEIILKILISFLIIFSLSSCKSWYYSQLTQNTEIIPDEFDPSKCILLVEHVSKPGDSNKPRKNRTNKLKKVLKKLYPYRYEIASADSILKNPKYADTSLYRFAIFNSGFSEINNFRTGINKNTSTMDFYFYDRSNKTEYGYSGNAVSSVKATFDLFIRIINRKLKEKKKG